MNAEKYFNHLKQNLEGTILNFELSEQHLKFSNIEDFEKAKTFLHRFYSDLFYYFENDFLEIYFTKEIDKELLNDLAYKTLDFNFQLLGYNVMDVFDYALTPLENIFPI